VKLGILLGELGGRGRGFVYGALRDALGLFVLQEEVHGLHEGLCAYVHEAVVHLTYVVLGGYGEASLQ